MTQTGNNFPLRALQLACQGSVCHTFFISAVEIILAAKLLIDFYYLFIKLNFIIMSSSNFVSGVLVGALAGLTIGILFAPEKGSDTRQKLMDKGNDLADALKDRFNKITGEGEDVLNEAGNSIEDLARKGKRKGKDLVDKTENKIEEWQDTANNTF
jgi:gas vesicle protein